MTFLVVTHFVNNLCSTLWRVSYKVSINAEWMNEPANKNKFTFSQLYLSTVVLLLKKDSLQTYGQN